MSWKDDDYYTDPWGGNEDLHRDGCLPMLVWGIIAALVCALIGGCKTRYVTIPEYHETIVTQHDTLITRDSIYHRDSISVWIVGDTIFKDKFTILYRDRWRDKVVMRDSVKVDSVRVPYPVEKQLTTWQRTLIISGRIFIIIVIAVVIIVAVCFMLRARRLIS